MTRARMKWIRALAPALLVLAIVLLVFGRGDGGRGTGQDFIRILELTPHDVEVGDRLTLVGDGFPSGKSARVLFRGTLFRPGQAPVRGAQIAATGVVVGPERVELEFSEPMERLFASTIDGLVHTTFEGDVEVGFAASTAGAPPVSGRLVATTLDVRPSVPDSDSERLRDGAKVLAALGIRATPIGSGLSIDFVRPGSRAQETGLAAGDVLARFDGVRVASIADVVPAPGERRATLEVFHGREITEHAISVEGIAATLPSARTAGMLLVLTALAVVFFFVAPLPVPIAQRVQRVASRLRAVVGGSRTPANRTWRRALGRLLANAWPSSPPTAIADAVALGLLATFSFGPTIVSARVDVALLFGIAASALAAVAMASQPSTWRGLRSAGHVAWQHMPAAVSLATVVVGASSLNLQEIARAQGGMPWQWLAFRNPGTLVAMMLVAGAGLIDPSVRSKGGLDSLIDEGGASQPPSIGGQGEATQASPFVQVICRLHRTIIAGITAALFLGGWILARAGGPCAGRVHGTPDPWSPLAARQDGPDPVRSRVRPLRRLARERRAAFDPRGSIDPSPVRRSSRGQRPLATLGTFRYVPDDRQRDPSDPRRTRAGGPDGTHWVRVGAPARRRSSQSVHVSVDQGALRDRPRAPPLHPDRT